ncbi:hypothetical protein F5883DRAFT_650090 [Diaporthe sp. PMI_573]|nr:hypothetical protein F5883DRAFT_650090 [Diaporthaceae sp. PMI_573]
MYIATRVDHQSINVNITTTLMELTLYLNYLIIRPTVNPLSFFYFEQRSSQTANQPVSPSPAALSTPQTQRQVTPGATDSIDIPSSPTNQLVAESSQLEEQQDDIYNVSRLSTVALATVFSSSPAATIPTNSTPNP